MKCENCGRGISVFDVMALGDDVNPRKAVETWHKCTQCNDNGVVVTLKGSMEFISLECTIGVGGIEK